jgi:hypothetical protein
VVAVQLPESPLVWVCDTEDDQRMLDALARIHAPALGRVAVSLSPSPASLRHVGFDILEALGKGCDLTGAGRNGTEVWSRALLWMVTNQVEELFVTRAQELKAGQTDELIKLAAGSGVRLWLIDQSVAVGKDRAQALERWPMQAISAEDFLERWAEVATAPTPSASHRRPLPPVPLDDFTSFRAACHDLLEPNDFERVDRAFLAGVRATERWLKQRDGLAEADVASHLRDAIENAGTYSEVLVRVRAAQVALFLTGWLLRVAPDVLAASQEPRVRDEPWVLEAIGEYCTPRMTAAATLALCTRLTLQGLVELDVGDVDLQRSVIHTRAGAVQLEEPSMRLVRAQALERRLQGGEDDEPLFLHSRGTGVRSEEMIRWTDRGVSDSLKKMERECGVLVAAHCHRGVRENDIAWMRRRGVCIQELA